MPGREGEAREAQQDEQKRSAKDDARVTIGFTLGPQYKLGTVVLTGDVPSEAAAALNLKTGDPAIAADVLAAADRIRRTLGDEGYAFAKVSPPHAKEVVSQQVLNVSIDLRRMRASSAMGPAYGPRRAALPTIWP